LAHKKSVLLLLSNLHNSLLYAEYLCLLIYVHGDMLMVFSKWFGSSVPISQGSKINLRNKSSSSICTSSHLLWFPTGFRLCEDGCYVIVHYVPHVFLSVF